MNKLNSIFMKTDPITNEELERYLSGEMTPEEVYQTELKMSGNPIYDDAIEGFKSSGAAMAGFAAVQSKFSSQFGASGTSSAAGSAGASSSTGAAGSASFTQLIGVCFSLSLITAMGLSVANESVKDNDQSSKNSSRVRPVIHQESISLHKEEESIAYDDVVEEAVLTKEIEKELVNSAPVPKEKTITYKKALENQPITVVDDSSPIQEPVQNIEPTPLEPVNIDPVDGVEAKEIKVHSNVRIVYLHELKTVDLSKLYERSIKVRNMNAIRPHTVDNDFKKNGPDIDNMRPYIYIPYQGYLNDAMGKFEANSFKSALKDYKVILSHYKDDVNAHFYGALCYYNLGKPSKAIDYFDKVLKDQINSFDQEAEYYKALCLIEAGKTREAEILLEKIEEDGLFYAKRARAERMKL